MIQAEKYMIIEPEDIVAACNRMERIMTAANEQIATAAPAIQGIENAAGVVVGDVFVLIAAAGVGAAICKQQGGLLVMKEDASQEDYQEAKAAMDELRKKQRQAAAAAKAAPETIPQ